MNSQPQFCPEDFSLAAEEAVHELCRGYEATLRSGESSSIERHLAEVEVSLRPLALYELVKLDAEFQSRRAHFPSREHYQDLVDSAEAASALEAALEECPSNPSRLSDANLAPDRESPGAADGPTTSPASLPDQLGRYVIQERLGQGGMGTVFKAFDSRLQRHVALKVPHYDRSSDARIRKRFRREALALASLRHDMIVPVYDVEREGDYEFLTMALIEGEPLRRYVQPKQPLAVRHAAVLVRSLAKAMQYVHDRGVIHRDLKPENIILEGGRKPVIVDFGLARAPAATDAPPPDSPRPDAALKLGNSLTRFGLVAGTPDYSSPEQLAGDFDAVGPRSDVYSLGVILFELLTGTLPWDEKRQGQNDASTGQVVLPLASELNSQVGPGLARICAQAIDPTPANRPQSMEEFADALKPFCAAHAEHHRLADEGGAPGNENVDAALVLQEITRQAEPRFSRPAPRRPSPVIRRTVALRAAGIGVLTVLILAGLGLIGERRPGRGTPLPGSRRQDLAEQVPSVSRENPFPRAAIPDWKPRAAGTARGADALAEDGPREQGDYDPPSWDKSIQRLIQAGAAITFEIPGASGELRRATVDTVGAIPQRQDCTVLGIELTADSLDGTLSEDLRKVLQRYQPSLRELGLHGRILNEATLDVIAQLTELEQLSLAETNLQNHNVRLLGQLTRLEHVDLSATDLSDDALADLITACCELKQIRSIDLRATDVSPVAARSLEEPFRSRNVAVRVLY